MNPGGTSAPIVIVTGEPGGRLPRAQVTTFPAATVHVTPGTVAVTPVSASTRSSVTWTLVAVEGPAFATVTSHVTRVPGTTGPDVRVLTTLTSATGVVPPPVLEVLLVRLVSDGASTVAVLSALPV